MPRYLIQKLWTAVIYVFLFAPIIMVVVMSFNVSKFSIYPVPGWSLKWYSDAFSDPEILQAIGTSAIIAISAALIASVIGTVAALALVRYSFRARKLLRAAFMSPLIIPEVVIAVALLALSTTFRLKGGLAVVIGGHALLGLPFVVTVVSARLHGFDATLEEAARDLGADERKTFVKVTLPLALPGVIAGLILAFTVSFDNFLVTYMNAGSDVVTIPLKIYSMMRLEFSPKLHAASTLVVAITIGLLIIYHVLTRRRNGETQG
jgi:spermidine/putrescine transport system permease protein